MNTWGALAGVVAAVRVAALVLKTRWRQQEHRQLMAATRSCMGGLAVGHCRCVGGRVVGGDDLGCCAGGRVGSVWVWVLVWCVVDAVTACWLAAHMSFLFVIFLCPHPLACFLFVCVVLVSPPLLHH